MKMNNLAVFMRLAALGVALALISTPLSGCLEHIYPKRRVMGPREGPEGQRPGQPAAREEEKLLRQAQRAQMQSRHTEALAEYERFLSRYPRSEYADSALSAVGQLRQMLGRRPQAIAAYEQLLKKHPQSRFADEARYRLAGLYLQDGRYQQAAEIAADLLNRTQAPEEQARLRIYLGRAYLGLGRRTAALDLFIQAMKGAEDPADRHEAQKGVKATVEAMTIQELAEAQSLFGEEYPGDYVSYVLAYRLYEAGRLEEALAHAQSFVARFPRHELNQDAQALAAAAGGSASPPPLVVAEDFNAPKTPPPPPPAPGLAEQPLTPTGPVPDYQAMNLAALLPLTGRGSEYGQKVMTGMKLAVTVYQPRTPGFKVNIMELDTHGDPSRAAMLVDRAAAESVVLAAVGPLVSQSAAEAAPRAESLGLPLITVSQKADLGAVGRHIFRLFLTPKRQAEAVARYAVQILGLRRLAIMRPEDTYGRTMEGYFRDEAQRLGAAIVSQAAYDETVTDFSPKIQELAGVGKARRRVVAGRKVQVGFEAVFLPDSYKAVAMIAPQFAYHDITTIRLLGVSLWHTPRLLETTARYVRRSVIPTAFYANMENPLIKRFVEAYRAEVGDEEALPDQFTAYGFDAALLLLTMMDQRRVSDREALTQALANMGPFSGVTGRFTFGLNGEYMVEPTLLTVENGEFKPIQ